jgi:hypothetical protein
MLGRLLSASSISLFLLTSQFGFGDCVAGLPGGHLTICSCTGFEVEGGTCKGGTGLCNLNLNGSVCGTDPDTGDACVVASASSSGCSLTRHGNLELLRPQNEILRSLKATVLTASIATCGGIPLPEPSNLMSIRKRLAIQ